MLDKRVILERGHQAYHMARTLTFLGEYKLLHSFTKLFRPWVQVPQEPNRREPALRDFILKDIEALFKRDAELFSAGILPLPVLKPESPIDHARRLTRILWTGVKMSRQRKVKRSKPTTQEATDHLPEYFRRNFHWQIDGYLSKDSAEVYDHQVEILFTGTAGAMRRLAIKPMNEFLQHFSGSARILEVATGTGELAHAVSLAYPQHALTLLDLSRAYLDLARERLQGKVATFVEGMAEAMPLENESQDLIYTVFMFHELPTEVRQKALLDMWRVLAPGGRVVIVDSIQKDEVPEYKWALEAFPRDYHEPFYKSYTEWNMGEALKEAGFIDVQTDRGFFSKVVWATKPS